MSVRHLTKEFFLNDRLAEVSTISRLFFMGLCVLADREGRLEDRPRRLKEELLPYDEADGEKLLAELSAHGLLNRYQAEGHACLAIADWRRWQKPGYREKKSAIPAPAAENKLMSCDCARNTDQSCATVRTALIDEKGMSCERVHNIDQSCATARTSSTNDACKAASAGGTDVGEVMHSSAFQSRTNKSITPKVLKETEEQKQEPSSSEVVRYEPEHRRLAETLREKILANKPDARVPAELSRWSETIRLMVERDKRKKERIAEVIDWATRDPFWSGNILSADSLRRHFDRLELAMQRSRGADSGGDAISRAAAKLERMGL